jgi:putative flippase GtrA
MSPRTPGGNLVRWLKFNIVGAIGVLVQLAVLGLLQSSLQVNYLVATALAVEAAVLHNFFWHEAFTWADRGTGKRLSRLVTFNLATGFFSIIGNLVMMALLVGDAGMSSLPANLISIAICSLGNFLIADRLVFV